MIMEELKKGITINGRYYLEDYKGSGSFGEVWRAYDQKESSYVAIKVYISLDKKGCDEFLDEYRIASGLSHPNLLVTKEYDVWNSRPFLTMSYCSKGSATNLIGNLHPCKEDEKIIWQFVRDVAAGLAYLHSIQPDPIVHQDIKPDNVLMNEDGSFLITDFGISKRVRSTLRSQSSRAQKAGAVAYMGPERFSTKPNPILASDVWSLGASIYELAEGELPFAGQGGIMLKHGADMVALSKGWSKGLNEVMQSCLAEKPWDRAKAYEIEHIASDNLADFDEYYSYAEFMEDPIDDPIDDPRATQRRPVLDPESEPPVIPEVTESDSFHRSFWESTFGKTAITIGLAAMVIIAIILWSGYESTETKVARSQLTYYSSLVDECKVETENGDGSSVKSLLDAKETLKKIKELEDSYSKELPEDYNMSTELELNLNPKLIEAAKAWAEAAKAQAENLSDYEQAKKFYELSLSLWDDPNVKTALDKLN